VSLPNKVVDDFLATGEFACAEAKRKGASDAEAYLSVSEEISIEIHEGRVETLKVAREQGMGLRAVTGKRTGFAFTSDLNRGAVEETVRRALANARETEEDPFRQIPPPAAKYPELDLFDSEIASISIEEKIKLAKNLEETGKAYDPRVKICERAAYQDGWQNVYLVNTRGIQNTFRATYCGLYLSLVAEENTEQETGYALDYRTRFRELDPVTVGREAARRAVQVLGARPVATQQLPVVLDPYVAVGFLGLVAAALSAEAVQKGRSLFQGKVGQRIASEKIDLIDDGTLAGGISSAPFDGEGIPTSRTVLTEKGVLQGYLHNIYTASKEGAKPTGNGIRSSYKNTPEVGPTNFFIAPGKSRPDDLVKDLKNGFYLVEVIGMHTANPISGDFSVGATGILIENGELTRPVRGVTIAGNIQELLFRVDGVGNDLKFLGSYGSPTIRIEQLVLGGH
jgi:PmbA protein